MAQSEHMRARRTRWSPEQRKRGDEPHRRWQATATKLTAEALTRPARPPRGSSLDADHTRSFYDRRRTRRRGRTLLATNCSGTTVAGWVVAQLGFAPRGGAKGAEKGDSTWGSFCRAAGQVG